MAKKMDNNGVMDAVAGKATDMGAGAGKAVQGKGAGKATDKRMLALQQAMEKIDKAFGRGTVMRMGEDARVPVEVIPTGSYGLDRALGCGGLPRGRVVEIYGPESSGKTTLATLVMAEAQRMGGIAAIIDAEHAFDRAYAEQLGVDTDNLLLAQPDNGEQALEIAEQLIRSGAVDVVVIDSVAALTPKAEIEGEMGDSKVGLQARLMSQGLRKLTSVVAQNRTLCIFINQLREKIGVMFGNPETTPGGLALKFYASVRLDIRRVTAIKDKDEVVGYQTRVKVVKNKVAPPFRKAEFDLLFGQGINREGEVLDAALAAGVMTKSGAFYKYGGECIGNGRERTVAFMREHPELLAEVEERLRGVMPAAAAGGAREAAAGGGAELAEVV